MVSPVSLHDTLAADRDGHLRLSLPYSCAIVFLNKNISIVKKENDEKMPERERAIHGA